MSLCWSHPFFTFQNNVEIFLISNPHSKEVTGTKAAQIDNYSVLQTRQGTHTYLLWRPRGVNAGSERVTNTHPLKQQEAVLAQLLRRGGAEELQLTSALLKGSY